MPGATPRGRRQTVADQMAAFQSYVEARQNDGTIEMPDTSLPFEERLKRAREKYKANG